MKRTITTCDICNREIPENVTSYKIEKHIPPHMNYTTTLHSKLDICGNCYKEFLRLVNRKLCKGSCKDTEPKRGLVFPFFNKKYIYEVPSGFDMFCVSCDYGTINPTSMGLWGKHGESWYRIDEFYHNSRQKGFQMTDEEYYLSLVSLVGERKLEFIVVDPSAASFIECIKRHGKFTVIRGEGNIRTNIYKSSEALETGKIKICKNCSNILTEIFTYSDDTPESDEHTIGDMTYFVNAIEWKIT